MTPDPETNCFTLSLTLKLKSTSKASNLLGPLLNYVSNQPAQSPRLNVRNAPKTITKINIQISEKGRNNHRLTHRAFKLSRLTCLQDCFGGRGNL